MRRWLATALRLSAAAALAAVLLLVLVLPSLGFILSMPALPALPRDWQPPTRLESDQGAWASDGSAQLRRVGGVWWLDAAGSPEALGAAQGLLLHPLIMDLEGDLVDTLRERVPTVLARHLLLGLVGLNNSRLPQFFQPRELREIRAATAVAPPTSDPWRAMGHPYQRALHYHALHDVSQYLIDNPLVRPIQVGCTAFAIGGPHSASGGLLIGRLFDFEGGPRFDNDKVVFTLRPDQGHAFMHVAWPGLTGAVTGMNERGIWVSINAAATSAQRLVGRPIIMAVREILQYASSIAEAEEILRRSPVFVSNGVLVASRDEQRAVLFEIGPSGLAQREAVDQRLINTNHFEHPAWAEDARNQQRLAEGTTTVRAARVLELLDGKLQQEPLSAADLAVILRDRRGLGDRDVGFHNRSTINAWIAAHLVIADLEAGLMWVAEPRHGLGTLRAFSIDGPLPEADLPADPELPLLRQHLARFQFLRDALSRNRLPAAQIPAAVAELLALNPQSFEAHWLAGRAAQAADNQATATYHLQRALELQPAYPADERAIRRSLNGEPAPGPGDPPADP